MGITSAILMTDDDTISKCISIKKLLPALSYYNKLKDINNQNGKILFCIFMDTAYGYLVYDDFII